MRGSASCGDRYSSSRLALLMAAPAGAAQLTTKAPVVSVTDGATAAQLAQTAASRRRRSRRRREQARRDRARRSPLEPMPTWRSSSSTSFVWLRRPMNSRSPCLRVVSTRILPDRLCASITQTPEGAIAMWSMVASVSAIRRSWRNLHRSPHRRSSDSATSHSTSMLSRSLRGRRRRSRLRERLSMLSQLGVVESHRITGRPTRACRGVQPEAVLGVDRSRSVRERVAGDRDLDGGSLTAVTSCHVRPLLRSSRSPQSSMPSKVRASISRRSAAAHSASA